MFFHLWVLGVFVFIVLPECIKAFRVRYETMYVMNPNGEILVATRRRPENWCVRKSKCCADWIANSAIFQKVKSVGVQCWKKAAMFLFAWVINTTTEFKVKIFIAILLTFATDFHKGVYEKYAEGADAWQMLKAGLDAMVIIASIFLFFVRKLIIIFLAVRHSSFFIYTKTPRHRHRLLLFHCQDNNPYYYHHHDHHSARIS